MLKKTVMAAWKLRQGKLLWIPLFMVLTSPWVQAQTPPGPADSNDTQQLSGDQAVPAQKTNTAEPLQPQVPVDPAPAAPSPTAVNPLGSGQYILEFSRSPVVGHRLRLTGIYDEARLNFTRPRSWNAKGAKIMLHYRHSSALYATRSNLTVLLNGTTIGSIPMNRKQGELGTVVYPIPAGVIQDYNEVVIAALQNNSPTCTQDPFDPSLWTEILPDSKIVFDFQPQPIPLDFTRYPYPLFDTLSLETNQVSYQLPDTVDETWLTAAARLQASLGRIAQHRPLDSRLLKPGEALQPNEKLVVIGLPAAQPSLASLKLPLPIKDNQILDPQQKPLPPDTGVLMLAKSGDGNNLVVVVSGNSAAGVLKAAQFLVQARDRQISTGQFILVDKLAEVATPGLREWSAYLPTKDSFQLQELTDYNNKPLSDVTVRGADAPVVEFDFRALPDDKFDPGNVMNLVYSYSAQVNPLTSMIEVQLDGVPLQGKRLSSETGATRDNLKVTLPPERLKPYSKLQVRIQLDPRERRSCSRATDQQLWGTIHADTQFNLNRRHAVTLPDLQLLQYGFPFAAPQDLSRTAVVVPDQPSVADLQVMLEFAERMGRISRAESVQLDAYRGKQLPEAERKNRHLVAIGTQATLPLPQVFQEPQGFSLQPLSMRRRDATMVQTLPDGQGVVKAIVSPWNPDRVLLALSAQSDAGLNQVRDLFSRDDLFFQLQADTVLIKENGPNPSRYDAQAYTLEFLHQARQTRELSDAAPGVNFSRFFQLNWFTIAPVTAIASLLLYGIFQNYLQRSDRAARRTDTKSDREPGSPAPPAPEKPAPEKEVIPK